MQIYTSIVQNAREKSQGDDLPVSQASVPFFISDLKIDRPKVVVSLGYPEPIAKYLSLNQTDDHEKQASSLGFDLGSKENLCRQFIARREKEGNRFVEVGHWLIDHEKEKTARALLTCSNTFVGQSCSERHRFARRIVCGRPICPKCGKEESFAHRRRYARAWGRIMWSKRLGYVVLTIPKEYRRFFRTKERVKQMVQAAWDVVALVFEDYFEETILHQCPKCDKEFENRRRLSDHLYHDHSSVDPLPADTSVRGEKAIGGLAALHFYGEEYDKKGNLCDTADIYHPHVNILFPTRGPVSKRTLNLLRSQWREALSDIIGEDIPKEKENARYEFSSYENFYKKACRQDQKKGYPIPSRDQVNERMKVHWIKYVLRATVGFDRFYRLPESERLDILRLVEKNEEGILHNVRWYGVLSNRCYRNFILVNRIKMPEYETEGYEDSAYICQKCGADSSDHHCYECGGWCVRRSVCPACHSPFTAHSLYLPSWVVGEQEGEIWFRDPLDPESEISHYIEIRPGSGYYADEHTFRELLVRGKIVNGG